MPRKAEIQGNIQTGFAHCRRNAAYLFLRLKQGRGVRQGLSDLLQDYVTSAKQQEQIEEEEERTMGMFGLSWTGYKRLGLTAAVPQADELGGGLFQYGMKRQSYASSYSIDDGSWDLEYKSKIDGFLLLARDSPRGLKKSVEEAKAKFRGIADVVKLEYVHRIFRNPKTRKREIEHFGFLDGVSTPAKIPNVFTPEPSWKGAGAPASSGCFAVVMKLEQDVGKFQDTCKGLSREAKKRGVSVSASKVAALAIGRHRNSEPLVPRGETVNDFDFRGASSGACPFHAHIRVMNRRNGGPIRRPTRRIVRRGMSYGPDQRNRKSRGSKPPSSQRSGLLFLSLQKSLLDFQSLLMSAHDLRDPILSRSSNWNPEYSPSTGCVEGGRPGQKWEIEGREICFPFADVTTLRGGEYFYIPSMQFIKELGKR